MKIRIWLSCLALVAGFSTLTLGASPDADLPDFLPTYFADTLTVAGIHLRHDNETSGLPSGAHRASYSGSSITLAIESVACERPRCAELRQFTLSAINKQASVLHGNFAEVEEVQFSAAWQEGISTNAVYVFELPRMLLTWTVRVPLIQKFSTTEYGAMLARQINRLRTEQASASDNVEFATWDLSIYAHARALREQGDTRGSLELLQSLRSWVPNDYAAQMDYAEQKGPSAEAHESAQTVLNNAEDAALTERAYRFLQRSPPSFESLPIISPPPAGLQAVFVALAPCDPLLVQDAAAEFSHATGIPATVVRLGEPWTPVGLSHLLFQSFIESTIVQLRGHDVDFRGWTRDQYSQELGEAGQKADALTRHRVGILAAGVKELPDQYEVTPILEQLRRLVGPIQASAPDAVFVGVSALPIFIGNANFVFSGTNRNIPRISMLSYTMMLASTLEETRQFRPRLVQRLAKEMVPATLSPLGVPRPADPSDPYSYADGVPRLDQKTLVLSSPTRLAIQALREKSP